MEVLWLFVLIVASFRIGFISCDDDITAGGKDVDIVGLLNRMDEFEKRENKREIEQKLLKIEMKELQIKVEKLEMENELLKKDIATLTEIINKDESDTDKHENDSDALKTDIEIEHVEIDESERMEMTSNGINDLNQDTLFGSEENTFLRINKRAPVFSVDYKTRIRNGVRQVNGVETEKGTAFYATLRPHLHNVGVNQTIVFDNVYTNIENAYNVHSGDFIAPDFGVYVFSATMMGYGKNKQEFRIVKNGSAVGRLYLNDSESINMTDSLTIVLYLNIGDVIAIKNLNADASIYGNEFCAFSGFLLHQNF